RVFENGVVDIFKNNRNLRVNVNRLKPYLRKDQDQVKKVFLENGKIKERTDPIVLAPKETIQNQNQNRDLNIPNQNFSNNDNLPLQPVNLRGDQPPPPLLAQQAAPQHAQPLTPETNTPPAAKRGRGRPRKIIDTPPIAQHTTPPPVSNQDEGGGFYPQENQPQNDNTELGGMLTRAKIKAMERAGIPPPQFKQMVNTVNRCIFMINHKKDYLTIYGTPKFPPKNKVQYYKRRIQFLKRLPVQKRNLLLTGDPLFEFDPVVYAHVFHNPAPEFEQIAQRYFNYFIPNPPPPPPPGFLIPQGQPPVYQPPPQPPHQAPPQDVELPHSSDEEVFQDFPAAAADPQEVPPRPEAAFRTPQGSPNSSPSHSSTHSTSNESEDAQNIQPEKSKISKEIENAQLLFQRLSTQEFPGGHRLRAKPVAPSTSSPRITSWPVLETKEAPVTNRRQSMAWQISPPATRRTSGAPPKPSQLPRTPPATFGQPARMVAPSRSIVPPRPTTTFGQPAGHSSPPSFASLAQGSHPGAQG
ncbi:MAG: hypothetical protein ACRC0J_10305, partial [Shewanella oncorhynchi]